MSPNDFISGNNYNLTTYNASSYICIYIYMSAKSLLFCYGKTVQYFFIILFVLGWYAWEEFTRVCKMFGRCLKGVWQGHAHFFRKFESLIFLKIPFPISTLYSIDVFESYHKHFRVPWWFWGPHPFLEACCP